MPSDWFALLAAEGDLALAFLNLAMRSPTAAGASHAIWIARKVLSDLQPVLEESRALGLSQAQTDALTQSRTAIDAALHQILKKVTGE